MYIQFFLVATNILTFLNCQEDFNFKIESPEFLCEKGESDNNNKDTTIIRFTGKDVQNLDYNFDVNFEKIGGKCRNQQRCTLIAWRAVRELDKFLKQYPRDKMKTGEIEINNAMFMPGLKYILKINVISNGTRIEERNLTLGFVDANVRRSITKPTVSLTLLAPNISYAYAPFVINAELIVCSNTSTYYFKWEILDTFDNASLSFAEKGAELNLQSNTFRSMNTYIIKCSLVNTNDNTIIAEEFHTVNILAKGLLVTLPVLRLTTAPNNPVRLKSFVRDLDNPFNEYQISWTCTEIDTNEQCIYTEINEAELDSSFENVGKYKVALIVKRNEYLESRSCEVEVVERAQIIEFSEIESPFAITSEISIPIRVLGLRTFCTLQWSNPAEDNYETLDLNTVPANINDLVNITIMNDVFLEEIDEFDKNTIDRSHDLTIPAPSENWGGLKGDAKYLFRLTIECPIFDEDIINETLAAENATKTSNIVINDFIVETNSPPLINPLIVTPDKGEAFTTKFNFKTEESVDKDFPVLYKFGIILENRELFLINLMGDTNNAEMLLPYSKSGIETVLEVCDSFNACNKTYGPNVKTDFPEQMSDTFYKNVMQIYYEKVKRGEYYKALSFAMAIIHSLESVGNSEQQQSARIFITEAIESEIDNFLNTKETNDEFKKTVNTLIENILSFNNESNTNLKILDSVIEKLKQLQNYVLENNEQYIQRRLLANSDAKINLQSVKNHLHLLEMSLKTLNNTDQINQEKDHLRKELHNYMKKICASLYQKSQVIRLELDSLIFDVEKISNNKKSFSYAVPFDGNSWNVSTKIRFVDNNSGQRCMGKAAFKDYFKRIGIIFLGEYFNLNEDINSSPENVTVYLPIIGDNKENAKCIVNTNNEWHDCNTLSVLNSYVKCLCKHFGYYYLTSYSTAISNSATTSSEVVSSWENSSAKPLPDIVTAENSDYNNISYVVIVGSIIGLVILGIILCHVLHDEAEEDTTENCDFPKYARLHDEDLLQDGHI